MNRLVVALVFFGVFATYAALTPGALSGVGYNGEEMQTGDSMLEVTEARLSGRPVPRMKWTRNGLLPVVLNVPFQVVGKEIVSEDFMLSFDPVLETALLISVLFLWLRKLTSPGLAFFLAMAAAFGTMLWPYAYIGLETKQSLFLLLAGYLALGRAPVRSFGAALVFGLCCAFAIGSKSNGFMLLPAVAYLGYVEFRDRWRAWLPLAVTALAVFGALLSGGAIAKSLYWAQLGVSPVTKFRALMNDSVFQYLGGAIGLFGSPNKGLLLYAPLVVLGLCAIPAAWRAHREVTLFVLLALGGTVLGVSFMRHYADEVWGCRYLHSSVAPLVLLIGASRKQFCLRRDAVMVPLAVLGVVVSFLGAFYYYGNLHFATMRDG